ncbi:MAG: hypothetical protein M1836_001827 [Candelina mexicana]|nr:MAG: hypothetical protein M1836_001827 [Candelina mexicana]
MDISGPYHSLKNVPSPNGALVFSLSASRFDIRSVSKLDIVRTIPLDAQFPSRVSLIRWSPTRHGVAREGAPGPSLNGTNQSDQKDPQESGSLEDSHVSPDSHSRILLADDRTVRIWDVFDEQWSATIDGAGGGVGKVVNVEFSHDGDEVLVFSEFGVKVTAWSLKSSRSVEIRDPKFSKRGFGYRPRTGHLALLTRPTAHDVITLHAPTSYKLLESYTLPTIDAQGLKWSPDGRWIAVWDAASSGYKVLVYTADGHLYRTYSGEREGGIMGLGIKSVDWSPRGDYLAVGDHDNRVTLLSSITFAPTAFLDHTTTIKIPHIPIWQEQVSGSGERSYMIAKQPMCPPSISSPTALSNSQLDFSVEVFANADGKLLATRNDHMPTTVWIWSLELMGPYAVLVHHSAVKSLLWHPTIPELLMIVCVQDEGIVYLWSAEWTEPRIFTVPLEKVVGKFEARWLGQSESDDPLQSKAKGPQPTMIFSDSSRYLLGYIRLAEGANAPEASPIASQEVLASSRYHHQDTESPIVFARREGENGAFFALNSSAENTSQSLNSAQGGVDDTFQHRHRHFTGGT